MTDDAGGRDVAGRELSDGELEAVAAGKGALPPARDPGDGWGWDKSGEYRYRPYGGRGYYGD